MFPYTNSRGNIMETEKNHSLKHAPHDIAKWGDSVNTSCEAPETGHKDWVKKQGGKTNQGPAVSLSMAQHTIRKEASALLCEAVQGDFDSFVIFCIYLLNMHVLTYSAYFVLNSNMLLIASKDRRR